jgi:hypothetical protein
MTQTLDSFSTLLQILTKTFLLEEPLQHRHPSHDKLQQAVANHQSSFTSLKKNLAEASSERSFYGGTKEDIARAYEDAVGSLNRLAQHLNGLRSGTSLQYELTKAHGDGKVVLRNRKKKYDQGDFPSESSIRDGKGKLSEEENEEKEEANILLQAAAAMFGDLVDDLGPPLKALTVSAIPGKCVNTSFTSNFLSCCSRVALRVSNVFGKRFYVGSVLAGKTLSNHKNSMNLWMGSRELCLHLKVPPITLLCDFIGRKFLKPIYGSRWLCQLKRIRCYLGTRANRYS